MMRAAEIASSIGPKWPAILEQLGIDGKYLRDKHGPCPACGGRDRYRFDNRFGRGGFYCNGCGAGDGFTLLQRVFGWDFKTARARVIEAAGIATQALVARPAITRPETPAIAMPTAPGAQTQARSLRARRLRRCARVSQGPRPVADGRTDFASRACRRRLLRGGPQGRPLPCPTRRGTRFERRPRDNPHDVSRCRTKANAL